MCLVVELVYQTKDDLGEHRDPFLKNSYILLEQVIESIIFKLHLSVRQYSPTR
jgi:hypothetical protein